MRLWSHSTGCGVQPSGSGRIVPASIRYSRFGNGNPLSGFTLIELLLVLVILATLALIVTPKFTRRSEQARITAARTQISQFEVALDAFEIDIGRYPTTAEGLRALVEKPGSQSEGWQQPYLKRDVPLDPWGNEYTYRYPGQYNQDGYDLSCYGPDGKTGGDDDITNWSDDRRY